MPDRRNMTREQREEERRRQAGLKRVADATKREIKAREAWEKNPTNATLRAKYEKAVAAVKALGGGRRTRRHSRSRRRTARR